MLVISIKKETLPQGYTKNASNYLINSAWSCEIRGVCVVGSITEDSNTRYAYFSLTSLSATIFFFSILKTEETETFLGFRIAHPSMISL